MLSPSGRAVWELEVECPSACVWVDLYDLDDGWFGAAIYAVDDTSAPLASAIYQNDARLRCAGAPLALDDWRAIDHAVARAVAP